MTFNGIEYIKSYYIPLLIEYLDGKITLDQFSSTFSSIFKADPLLYGNIGHYPDSVSEIINTLFLDIEDADSIPEVMEELFIPEERLQELCHQHLSNLLRLTKKQI